MRHPTLTLCAALGLALCATAASARTTSLLFCDDGGPGNTSQAAPKVEQFLRHIERTVGVEGGSLTGEYHTDAAGCVAYFDAKRPEVAVVDLATLLRHGTAWKLSPVAHVGEPAPARYYVLARKGTVTDLSALDGKTVIAALPDDRAYLSKIVLDGKGSPDTWKLSFTARPLKGLRAVAREEADATIVDAATYAHLSELALPTALVSIYESPSLPRLTMVAVGQNGGAPDLVARLTKNLDALCKGEGKELCQQLQVDKVQKAESSRFESLRRSYGR
ncbi:MAG: hypothetical protein H6746_19850 [Deltaproteobacteria bacterium]|nr:hypothetical protein [Deltaproteobacteria bacterium]